MKKKNIGILFLVLILSSAINLSAQTTKKKSTSKTSTTKSKSTTPKTKAAPVAVTVTLKSNCERNLMIFAGPKEKLANPLLKEIGGLSANIFYMKTGETICIMDAKKKPMACANISKTTSKLEINFTGTAIAP